jgi:hypothetical protein
MPPAAPRRAAPGLDAVAEVLRWVGEPAPPAPRVEPAPSLDVSIGAIEIAIDAPPQRPRVERTPPARSRRIRDTRLARRLPRIPGGG